MATGSYPTTAGEEIWCATGRSGSLDAIEDYSVQAADGVIGTVAAGSSEPGRSYLIATGGSWNHGRMVMLPPGVVERIDRDARTVYVRCAREQVREAPPFENDRYQDAAYRVELGAYYASVCAPAASAPAPRSTPPWVPAAAPQGRFGLLEHWFGRVGAG